MNKDFFGNEINVNDWICYGGATGHAPLISVGKVDALKDNKIRIKAVDKTYREFKRKTVWIENTFRKVIILNKDLVPDEIKAIILK